MSCKGIISFPHVIRQECCALIRTILLLAIVSAVVAFSQKSHAQVANGDFSGGSTGWTTTLNNGSVSYGGNQLSTVSPNSGFGHQRSYASQSLTTSDPGYLTFRLVSWTTNDYGRFDYPLIRINGVNNWVSPTGGLQTNGTGAIDNDSAPLANLTVRTTLAAGTRNIAAGVGATDSCCGSGTAVWDDIEFQELTQSPGAQSFNEDTVFAFSGANSLSTATNSGAASITVQLAATNGTLAISTGTGLITAGANNSSGMTLTGSPAAVNAALATLTYEPTLNFNGPSQLTFTANDGTLSDTDIIPFTVVPVPDYAMTVQKNASPLTVSSAGETITYTINVDNTGDTDLTSVAVTDTLTQNGTSQVLTTTGPLSDTGTAGAIDPGETWQFTASHVVTQAQMNDGGDLDNTAQVQTAQGPLGSDSATTAINVNRSVAIDKSATLIKAPGNSGTEAETGDTINYVYDVTNDGNQSLSPIVVTDVHSGAGSFDQPAGETLLTDLPPLGDSTDATANDGNWTTLQPGDTIRFTASYVVVQQDMDMN
jgi:uncharacterized repeat protein (TIGR01451 family)